jgi:hypothetical protein
MPDRASVFEKPFLALETTPGTPAVTDYKQLQSMSIEPGIKTNVETFRPMGSKFVTVAAQGKEWTEAKMSGQPTFTELIYPLSSICGQTTPTTVGSSTKKWVFGITNSAADNPATFTIEQGSSLRVGQYVYGILKDFNMKFARDKIGMDGGLMAQRYRDDKTRWLSISGSPSGGTFTVTINGQTTSAIARNATAGTIQTALAALSSVGAGNVACYGTSIDAAPVLIVLKGAAAEIELTITTTDSLTGGTSPATALSRYAPTSTALALVPILPQQVSVKLADTQAGLAGASAMTRVLEAGFNIGGRFDGIWPLNAAVDSWDGHVELAPKSSASLKMAADSNGMPLLVNLRKGTTKFMEISAVGDATEAGQTYLFKAQMGLKITDIGDWSDANGLYAVDFSAEIAYDATWGKAIELTVQNLLTAL